FQIQLRNEVTGEAELLAKRPLNCEKRKNYKFDITAISCDGIESENVTVHVKVNDVNEFAPVFVDPSYVVSVDEGRLYDEIVTLRAEDQDCSPKYGDICRYELLTKDQPFVVDSEGVVRNTEILDYERSHNHILSFVAYDCGMKRSQPVMVTVKVNRVCHLGWKGIPKQVEYSPGSGRQELFPSASLELCSVPCSVERVQSRIGLVTNHIGKGCDRDTYSVPAQRKMCGASDSSIELLPSPGPGKEWTSPLHSDEGHEGDLIFQFEGDNSGIRIPDEVMSHNLTNTFTISSWMKHKSHSADKVCDNEWHHYSVQANLPEVNLYVDGHLFHPETSDTPEVIDDWPLHPTRGIETTMTVGACWQGSEGIMKHGFVGYLAGLSILSGSLESPRVLSCLTRCQEALDTPAMELLQPSMELLTNNEMTQITVEGNNVTNVETLIRRVAYINNRDFPTPGRRPVSLTTNILCTTGKALKIGTSESFVVVLQPHQPSIEINGTTNFVKEYEAFRQGLRIFPDISIYLSAAAKEAGAPTPGGQLDECSVMVYPPLNPDHETLVLPDNLIAELGLAATVTRQGATISGAHNTLNYQKILRQIHYTNRKPAYYLNRAFKLSCSELGGRFTSNEYTQTVTVIHPQLSVDKVEDDSDVVVNELPESHPHQETKIEATHHEIPLPAHHKISPQHAHIKEVHITEYANSKNLQGAVASSASHTVTIIVVVCVGFLVFLVVLGVLRVRAVHSRGATQEEANAADVEMAWDDSALNITVNPMEASMEMGETQHLRDRDDDDSSDEGSNFNDELEESSDDDDEEIVTKQKELEWDDSTLKI
ncbi:Calsyntenin-1, partial [Armadillidium vulgare]